MSSISDTVSSLYSIVSGYSSTSTSEGTDSVADDATETLTVSDTISASYTLSESLLSLISGEDNDSLSSDFSGLYSAIEMKANESEINNELFTYYTDLLTDVSGEESRS